MKKSPFFENCVLYALEKAVNEKDASRMLQHGKKVHDYIIEHEINYDREQVINVYHAGIEAGILNGDQLQSFLRYEIYLLQYYDWVEDAVSEMCRAAGLFADFGAYQSAYRLLFDANNYAIEKKCIGGVLCTLETQGMICLEEGDIKSAEHDLEGAEVIYFAGDEEPSIQVQSNLALIKLRRGKFEEAEKRYEKLLEQFDKGTRKWWKIRFNKIICAYRRGADVFDELSELEELFCVISEEEQIEYEIFAAEVNLQRSCEKTIALLYQCIQTIQGIENRVAKLHYRRGIREKYYNRITFFLEKIKGEVPHREMKKLFEIFLFLKINACSEWCAALQYLREHVPAELKENEHIWNVVQKLIRAGTPVLYGFEEKYDDPFEEYGTSYGRESTNQLWGAFCSELSEKGISVQKLYSYAHTDYIARYMMSALEENMYLFVFPIKKKLLFWYNEGNVLKRIFADAEGYCEFEKIFLSYSRQAATPAEFMNVLHNTTEQLKEEFAVILEFVKMQKKITLHFFTDNIFYNVPYHTVFLEQAEIREKIQKKQFCILYHPLIVKSSKKEPQKSILEEQIDVVTYEEENLPLQQPEYRAVEKKFSNIEKIGFEEWCNRIMHEEKMVHVSSHGLTIELYTDPIFSSLTNRTHEDFGIETLQNMSWNMHTEFAFLNCCYAANCSTRNYQKRFLTNELIGYHLMFQLNGKCEVIAPEWPVKDIIAYIFTEVFYKKLSEGCSYAESYMETMTFIYDATVCDVLEIIETIEDERVRENKIQMLKRCPIEYPFRDTFYYGGYRMFSLL